MQTALAPSIKDTPAGHVAERILRSCVHCGFCNATCPTYQLLGDELDGPRGRIYLIKQALEGAPVTQATRTHLDRCLTCLACETTCPSGVQYHRLLAIGRDAVERAAPRALPARVLRRAMIGFFKQPRLFGASVRLARILRPLLPSGWARQFGRARAREAPLATGARRMILLAGCVQPALAPAINDAAVRVLARAGIALTAIPTAGCCGALSYHLSDADGARADARRNIDAWWPHIEQGAEAIVITASGCGTQIKDYGDLLRDDAQYRDKAARVSTLAKDIVEVVGDIDLAPFTRARTHAVAFHAPCSLQHGQALPGRVERILQRCGYRLTAVADAHLCCGSAGTYSITQPALSQRLLANKLAALGAGAPAIIATANIGCLTHLASGTRTPVRHWIELLEE